MNYCPPIWVHFRHSNIVHLVRIWWVYRSEEPGVRVETVCGCAIDIKDPVRDLRECSGFDERSCLQCRRSWHE